MSASITTVAPTRSAADAASTRFSVASSRCAGTVTSASRLPYSALSTVQPSEAARPTATSMLARNRALSDGRESSPRSPAAMSPASKLSPTSCTPASVIAVRRASRSRSAGTGSGNGHQSSIASNPAAAAAAGRSSSGSSVKRMERLTS
ncbi:hypothetical protein BJF90_26230 [Pseudonocardia sp. CNS-004]|nr:hypothetical protein BJF90_26230 [Pseudonocardia sp. CNS-004]